MNKLIIIGLFFCFCICLNALDTLQKTKPIVINGIKSTVFTEVLNSVELKIKSNQKYSPLYLSDYLGNNEGLVIRDYGGLSGMKTISINGANANQSAVLINGFKIADNSTGMIDMSLLNISDFSTADLVRNGISSNVGSNGMFGALNFSTALDTGNHYCIGYNIASFNTNRIYANLLQSSNLGRHSLKVDYLNSDNSYKYSTNYFNTDTTFTRVNSGIKQISISTINELNVFDNKLNFYFNYINNNRSIPGIVISGKPAFSDASLINNSFITTLNYRFSDFQFNFGYRNDDQEYSDSLNYKLIGAYSKFFYNKNLQTSVTFNGYNSYWHYSAGTGVIYEKLNSILTDTKNYENVSRLNLFGYINLKYFFENDNNMFLNSSLRYDNIQNINQYSYNLSFSIFDDKYLASVGIARSFRLPGFNEIYYYNFGNRNIKPETAFNIYSNLNYKINQDLNLYGSVYYYNINNKIISLPVSFISWSTQNLGNYLTYGFDSKVSYKIDELELSVSYVYNKSFDNNIDSYTYKKNQPYNPNHQIFGSIKYKYENFNCELNYNYLGERFSDYNNSTELILNSQNILNFKFSYLMNIGSTIENTTFSLIINNVLDKQYEMIKNFPLAGINYNAGVSINL